MPIPCVYCGGAHRAPAEVKACWQRSTEGGGPGPEAPAVVEPVAPVPATTAGIARVVAAPALGRNVVVAPGAPAPAGWEDAPRLAVTGPEALPELRVAAHARRALVLELDPVRAELGDADRPPATEERRAPHLLGPRFELPLDELHHLVWSNSIDLRDPAAPRWALLDRTVALGATAGGPADVVLPDGRPVWLDGGPIRITDPIDGVPVLHAVAVEHGSLRPPTTNRCPADLATDQLAAVTHPGGAARIIAPAGSGKTRVLTERARHLLTGWALPPGAVSLVAFNKRAQEEMRSRTADLPGLQVRTLNAIALAIVNGTPPFAPQSTRWRTIDEPEVRRIIGRLVAFPKRRNTDPVAPWIEALSLIRLGLVDPAEVEARYGGDVDGLADVWPRYRAALERDGAVDFDDQIHRAIEVLLTQPTARAAAQRACRVLLVDEFQDLTPAHVLLVRLLAAPGGAVFGVGDDDQTIYGYNGADPAWLIDFATLFPGAGDHPLEVNYRCPAGVVTGVDRLLRRNRRRVAKTIVAASSDPDGWRAVTADDPVAVTVDAVRAALAGGAAPADLAVLTRVNALLAPVQAGLAAAGVAVRGGVGVDFTERTAVRAVLAWLRLAAAGPGGPFAGDDLAEALRRPSRPLRPNVGGWVAEQRDLAGLRRLAGRLNEPREADRVAGFADDVERLQGVVAGGGRTLDVVAALVDDLGLAGSVATLDDSRRGMNRAAQGDDLTAVRQLALLQPDPRRFERWLREMLGADRSGDGVVLATVHRVKGQEWPHVVVHLADADQYPHRLADDVEEERRLFHVALTRASRHATVVSGPRPSRFVEELRSEPSADTREVDPAPVVDRRRRVGTTPADGPASVLADREVVVAGPGLVLVDHGTEWRVVELDDASAVAAAGAATRRFPAGRRVETAGRQRGVLTLPPGDVPATAPVLYDELRRFRERVRGGKPAYTVFDDKTLAAIALAAPSGLDELARVRGVGPAKLELYGDAVLELTAATTPAADP